MNLTADASNIRTTDNINVSNTAYEEQGHIQSLLFI